MGEGIPFDHGQDLRISHLTGDDQETPDQIGLDIEDLGNQLFRG
jgi:hypothetical protein